MTQTANSTYSYTTQKSAVFLEENQRAFLHIRDRAFMLIARSGAARLGSIIDGSIASDSWVSLACVDRLAELGELIEIPQQKVGQQHRIFISGKG